MALDGLMVLVCAGALVGANPPVPATENPDSVLATTLAVQTAMQQGRDHLVRAEYKAAVTVLESQLAYINGNKNYLKLLQDAYRGYVKELRLAKQDAEAQRYLARLRYLDAGAILDSSLAGPGAGTSPGGGTKSSAPLASKPAPKIRLKGAEETLHVSRAPEKQDSDARLLLTRAEQKFSDHLYPEARLLFEQAYQVDQGGAIPEECRERWAYCKLYYVVEQLNQAGGRAPWPELEQEVRTALDLAPRLEYGKSLLTEIQKRREAGATSEPGKSERPLPVRHGNQTADGWLIAETANFRIFHKQSEKLAEDVAQVAERTRMNMLQKWFGSANEAWTPKCSLYLHATAQDYGRATGYYNSPGHSTLKMENGRLVIRRIDLHCDEASMLTAVLPHETTHVVLAGQFGEQLVPRWADEGMAVLTEPKEKQERHRKNLLQGYRDAQLFHVQTLFQMENYPQNPHDVSAFYAQSVSLVDYLSTQRGPQEFSLFLLDSMRYGYEKSLQRHYEFKSFAELEQRWIREVIQEQREGSGVAQQTP